MLVATDRQTKVYCRKPVRRDLASHDTVQCCNASKLTRSMVKVPGNKQQATSRIAQQAYQGISVEVVAVNADLGLRTKHNNSVPPAWPAKHPGLGQGPVWRRR